jgi:hypothetical protein
MSATARVKLVVPMSFSPPASGDPLKILIELWQSLGGGLLPKDSCRPPERAMAASAAVPEIRGSLAKSFDVAGNFFEATSTVGGIRAMWSRRMARRCSSSGREGTMIGETAAAQRRRVDRSGRFVARARGCPAAGPSISASS